MGKIGEFVDRIILSDHEYKKKYCPHLYSYLFVLNDKERSVVLKKHAENRKVCNECYGIYFEEECPECNHGKSCGGYVLNLN